MDPVTVLSLSWRLLEIIGQILGGIQQPKEHGRALLRLQSDAVDFLDIVASRLEVLPDITPYKKTIERLEALLVDIKNACSEYSMQSRISQIVQANSTRGQILELDRRLRSFVDTYLIRAAADMRVDLRALAHNIPRLEPRTSLPDEQRWRMMSSNSGASVAPSRQSVDSRIRSWLRVIPNPSLPPNSSPPRPLSLASGWHDPEPLEPMPASPSENHSHNSSQRIQSLPPSSQGFILTNISPTSSNDSPFTVNFPSIFTSTLPNSSTNGSSSPRPSIHDSSIVQPRSPTATTASVEPGAIAFTELALIALRELDAQRLFPLIFSVGESLDVIVCELETLFMHHLLQDTSGIKLRILDLVTRLSRELWLSDAHRRLILDKFGPKSIGHIPDVIIASNLLSSLLLPTFSEGPSILPNLLAALLDNRGTTKAFAEALAILEQDIRQSDPLGECVRWLARGHRRDLLSFPEMVGNLVLQSILTVAAEDMTRCCQKFIQIAEHSKSIENYSAMRAIVTFLTSLTKFHMETSFIGSGLERMSRTTCVAYVRKAKNANRPYLCPLPDVLPNHQQPVDIINGRRHVRWSLLKEVCQNVDQDVLLQQNTLFTSHHPYSFHRGPLVDRVRRILINMKPIDVKRVDLLATKRYQDANKTRILFRHA